MKSKRKISITLTTVILAFLMLLALPLTASAEDCRETTFKLKFGPKNGDDSKKVDVGDVHVKRTSTRLTVSINTGDYVMKDNWLVLSSTSTAVREKLMNPPDREGEWKKEDHKTSHTYTIEIPGEFVDAEIIDLEVHVGFFGDQTVVKGEGELEEIEKLDSARGYGSIAKPTATTTDPGNGDGGGDGDGDGSNDGGSGDDGNDDGNDGGNDNGNDGDNGGDDSKPSDDLKQPSKEDTDTTTKPEDTTKPTTTSKTLPFTGMNGWGLLAALLMMIAGGFIYSNSRRLSALLGNGILGLPRPGRKK